MGSSACIHGHPLSYRQRPAALPMAEVLTAEFWFLQGASGSNYRRCRCDAQPLHAYRSSSVKPNPRSAKSASSWFPSLILQSIHIWPKYPMQDVKESQSTNTNSPSKMKDPGDGAQKHNRTTTWSPSPHPVKAWMFPEAPSDLLLSVPPLAVGSAVQMQPFQPERDSFQDQSSPPQSLPEALLVKPMHPLQPLQSSHRGKG